MSSKLKRVNPQLAAPIIWAAIKDDPKLPSDYSLAKLRVFVCRCYCLGIYVGDELAGIAAYEGNELHTSILPAWQKRWFSRAIGQGIIDAGLARFDHIITTVDMSQPETRALALFVGFRLLRTEGARDVFILEREGR